MIDGTELLHIYWIYSIYFHPLLLHFLRVSNYFILHETYEDFIIISSVNKIMITVEMLRKILFCFHIQSDIFLKAVTVLLYSHNNIQEMLIDCDWLVSVHLIPNSSAKICNNRWTKSFIIAHGFKCNLDITCTREFFKDLKLIALVLPTRAILRSLKNSLVHVISKLHLKPCYYLYKQLIYFFILKVETIFYIDLGKRKLEFHGSIYSHIINQIV